MTGSPAEHLAEPAEPDETARPAESNTTLGGPADRGAQGRLGSVWVIVNPASGGAVDVEAVAAALKQGGAVKLEVLATTEDDPGIGQSARAVAEGATLVVACGGDGTVRACAASLAGTDVPLAVVPAGTGNLLARNLGIGGGLDDAIVAALHGELRRIDVGVAGGEVFTVMAGIGFDAMMIRDANPTWKARVGSLAYVASALKHLRHRPAAVQVRIIDPSEASDITGAATMVLAGNMGVISGGLRAFPRADPTDGLLDLATMNASNLRSWLLVLGSVVRRSNRSNRRVRRGVARSLVITCRPPRPWELDGEDRPAVAELSISIRPAALQVCCPTSTDGPVPE